MFRFPWRTRFKSISKTNTNENKYVPLHSTSRRGAADTLVGYCNVCKYVNVYVLGCPQFTTLGLCSPIQKQSLNSVAARQSAFALSTKWLIEKLSFVRCSRLNWLWIRSRGLHLTIHNIPECLDLDRSEERNSTVNIRFLINGLKSQRKVIVSGVFVAMALFQSRMVSFVSSYLIHLWIVSLTSMLCRVVCYSTTINILWLWIFCICVVLNCVVFVSHSYLPR